MSLSSQSFITWCRLAVMVVVVFSLTLKSSFAADKPQRSSAKADSIQPLPAIPELLSYDTLIGLPNDARSHYLRQLQLLLIDMASISHVTGSRSIVENDPAGFLEMLELFFPVANASGSISCMNPVTDFWGSVHCENGYVTTDGIFVPSDSQQTKDAYERAAHPALFDFANTKGVKPEDPNARDQCYPPQDASGKFPDYKAEDNFCSSLKTKKGARKGACVYAGNISEYDQKGRCLPPLAVCGDGTVLHTASGKCPGGKAPLKCKAGEVVCNPVTFGAKSNTEPFCVEVGGGLARTATRGCEILSRKQAGNKYSENSMPPESYLAIGDSEANEKAWKKLKEGFSKLCGKDDSQELARNCDACKVMRRRLMAMNARVKEAKQKAAKANSGPQWNSCQWSADEDQNIQKLEAKDVQSAAPAKAAQ